MNFTIKTATRNPQIFIWITALLSVLSLIGWLTNLNYLAGQWGSYIPMAPISALVLLFQSITLILYIRLRPQNRRIALTVVFLLSFLSLLVFTELIAGIKVIIVHLFSFSNNTFTHIAVTPMSPLTAVLFLLFNLAIFILFVVHQTHQTTTIASISALIAIVINFIIIQGYLFGSPLLYGGNLVPTALPTAIALLSEGIAVFLLAAPYSIMLRSWNSRSFKGRLIRAFLFPIVAVVLIQNWLETRIEIHAADNRLLFHALLALILIFVIIIVITFIAKHMGESIEKADDIIQKQNNELLRLNASKDKFFSIIAHDLKSPFLGFLGLTQDLARNSANISVQETAELGSTLHQSAENLFNLLHNLLEWTQMQDGSITLMQKNILLSELITKNIQMIIATSRQKGIIINNLISDSIHVCADEKMLDSVLLNLLSNAVKFTPRNGSITIGAKIIDNLLVELSIQDTGIGMSKSLIEKLFKVGEKIGRKGTDGELSTGLGLMLCKEFIEKNGGTIRVESHVGKGSTFYFTLQLAK